jgi:hypothetical protein
MDRTLVDRTAFLSLSPTQVFLWVLAFLAALVVAALVGDPGVVTVWIVWTGCRIYDEAQATKQPREPRIA